MNSFDAGIEHFLNQYAGRWPRLDVALALFTSLNLFKGGMILALVWWIWSCREQRRLKREFIIGTLVGVVLALAAVRLLAHILPFRPRPLHDPSLLFRAPAGVDRQTLTGWSAFPSDHAALFFGISTGLWLVHRGLGLLALAYTALFIALPRAYLGFHYPTDLIVGGLLGATFVFIACATAIRQRLARPFLALASRRPGAFHAAFFLFTLQVATLFDAIRAVWGHARP